MASRDIINRNYSVYETQIAGYKNVANRCDNTARLYDKNIPTIHPRFGNEEIDLDAEIVSSGLSAISIKHHNVTKSLNTIPSNVDVSCKYCSLLPVIQPRNSFRHLHKPDLQHVACFCKMSDEEVRIRFAEHALRNNAKSETFSSSSDDSTSLSSICNLTKMPCEDCITLYTSDSLGKESSISLRISQESMSCNLQTDSDVSQEFKLQHRIKELSLT